MQILKGSDEIDSQLRMTLVDEIDGTHIDTISPKMLINNCGEKVVIDLMTKEDVFAFPVTETIKSLKLYTANGITTHAITSDADNIFSIWDFSSGKCQKLSAKGASGESSVTIYSSPDKPNGAENAFIIQSFNTSTYLWRLNGEQVGEPRKKDGLTLSYRRFGSTSTVFGFNGDPHEVTYEKIPTKEKTFHFRVHNLRSSAVVQEFVDIVATSYVLISAADEAGEPLLIVANESNEEAPVIVVYSVITGTASEPVPGKLWTTRANDEDDDEEEDNSKLLLSGSGDRALIFVTAPLPKDADKVTKDIQIVTAVNCKTCEKVGGTAEYKSS
jgi:WD40 repeat protein